MSATCQFDLCDQPLPVSGRGRVPRFCSPRHRVAAHRAGSIPLEMRQRPRWVRYSARKVPLMVDGRAARSTDPETWSTYTAARASKAGTGLGFVLNGDGIVCLDLDHCLVDGRLLRPWSDLLEDLPATYTEVSMSGRGLHVFLRTTLPRSGRIRFGGVRVEGYATGRYIAVTGNRWADAPSRLGKL